MSRDQCRLPVGPHAFNGRDIDRAAPLSFLLDGMRLTGFAGDTILSAALAAGITGAGWRNGLPLALDEQFAPTIVERSHRGDRTQALPMERVPAVDGLDLVTFPHSRSAEWRRRIAGLSALGRHPPASLHCRFDGAMPPSAPWLTLPTQRELTADVTVVGGGLAGMSAALQAARAGARVVLIERRRSCGGDARFFGSVGDDESPDVLIERARLAIAGEAAITVLVLAEAFAVSEGVVRLHRVELRDGHPVGEVISIQTPRIVLATGTVERLPLFPGNRSPGVVRAATAFDRADRFGVWLGRNATLSTVGNVAYRVATQARNAGIEISRIADTRADPHSRFIEFSKAHGIPLVRGLRPLLAEPARRGAAALNIRLGSVFSTTEPAEQLAQTDQLLVAGGWQPELTLWHMAGGRSRWQAARRCLEAEGSLVGIALAGAAAGYRNPAACVQSGATAIAALLARRIPVVEDPQIEAVYETPDDPTPIAPPDPASNGDCYLDGGWSLNIWPGLGGGAKRAPWPLRKVAQPSLAGQARPLSLVDVAAGVELGLILPEEAPIVAQERCTTPGDLVEIGRRSTVQFAKGLPAAAPPAYLAGRFGPRPGIWLLEAADGRNLETGCLVYPNAELRDARHAIGVVFAPSPAERAGGLAVIAEDAAAAGASLFVRHFSTMLPVVATDPDKPLPVEPVAPLAEAAPVLSAAIEVEDFRAPMPDVAVVEASEIDAADDEVNVSEVAAAAPLPIVAPMVMGGAAAWTWLDPRRRHRADHKRTAARGTRKKMAGRGKQAPGPRRKPRRRR